MKTLNKTATKIFSQLLLRLGNKKEHAFSSAMVGGMPLTIQVQDEQIETPFGNAKTYRLYHHYTGSGRQLFDPEMYFLVADERLLKTDIGNLHVIPCYFLQDSTGIEEESIRVASGTITNIIALWQAGHVVFANEWLVKIRKQGYLR